MGCTEREDPESPPSSALGRKPTVAVYIDNFRPGVWIESLRNILLLFHQNIPGEQNIAGVGYVPLLASRYKENWSGSGTRAPTNALQGQQMSTGHFT